MSRRLPYRASVLKRAPRTLGGGSFLFLLSFGTREQCLLDGGPGSCARSYLLAKSLSWSRHYTIRHARKQYQRNRTGFSAHAIRCRPWSRVQEATLCASTQLISPDCRETLAR